MTDITFVVEAAKNSAILEFLKIIMPPIIAFIGIFWAAALAMKNFYSQQRANHTQKIYFENALFTQLKNLEKGLTVLDRNISRFQFGINLALNWSQKNKFSLSKINEIFSKIVCVDKQPQLTSYYPKEVITDLLGKEKAKILTIWAAQAESDLMYLIEITRGILLTVGEEVSFAHSYPQYPIEDRLQEASTYVGRNYELVRRHTKLISLMTRLVNLYTEVNFKNVKKLLAHSKNKQVLNILKDIDECFKLLFLFYKANETMYYSYAVFENHKRIKLDFTDETLKASLETFKPSHKDTLVLIGEQSCLAEAQINDKYVSDLLREAGRKYLLKNEKLPTDFKIQKKFTLKKINVKNTNSL